MSMPGGVARGHSKP